jgi:hypothetical protein
MTFDPKKNQAFLITVGAILLAAIVVAVLWRGAAGTLAAAVAELDGTQSSYDLIAAKHRGEPSQELVKKYQQKLADSKEQAAAMRTAVPERALPSYSPASFKETVRGLRDRLYAAGTEANVVIPEDIGFSEYLGEKVPEKELIPKLSSQLAIVQDVLEILLTNRAVSVMTIDRNPDSSLAGSTEVPEDVEAYGTEGPSGGPRLGKTADAAAGKARAVYTTVPVKFDLRIAPGKLYSVFADLRNKDHFYRIRRVRAINEVMAQGEMKDPSDITEEDAIEMVVDHVLPVQAPAAPAPATK